MRDAVHVAGADARERVEGPMPTERPEDHNVTESRSTTRDERTTDERTDVPRMPDRPVPVYPSTTMAQPIPAGGDQLEAIDDLDEPQR